MYPKLNKVYNSSIPISHLSSSMSAQINRWVYERICMESGSCSIAGDSWTIIQYIQYTCNVLVQLAFYSFSIELWLAPHICISTMYNRFCLFSCQRSILDPIICSSLSKKLPTFALINERNRGSSLGVRFSQWCFFPLGQVIHWYTLSFCWV